MNLSEVGLKRQNEHTMLTVQALRCSTHVSWFFLGV